MSWHPYAGAWQAMAAASAAATITTPRTVTPIPVSQQGPDEPFPPPQPVDPDVLREPPRDSTPISMLRDLPPPEKLSPIDRSQIDRAVIEARKQFGPSVAELIERELFAWKEFAYRFDNKALLPRVVAEILAGSEPKPLAA